MREKPILFSGTMVKAILEGRKTQTRRIVKLEIDDTWRNYGPYDSNPVEEIKKICPHGSVGDRLWVRESFRFLKSHDRCSPSSLSSLYDVFYDADNAIGFFPDAGRLRPSIHMPRWASRITLEVTGIRVERLQDISEEDAQAEGIYFTDYGKTCFHPKPCPLPNNHEYHLQKPGWSHKKTSSYSQCIGSPRHAFARLWDSINSDRAPWESNPWVWVIEFKTI